MGLDQFLYKVKRMEENEAQKLNSTHIDTFPRNVWSFFSEDIEKEANEGMFRDLLPFMRKVEAITSVYDIAKMKADNDIPQDARIFGRGFYDDRCEFNFVWGKACDKQSKLIVFSKGEYIKHKIVDVYVCYAQEVYYWRKNYQVQETIYDYYDREIENCGYYLMDEEFLAELVPELEDYEDIMYHEWY